MPVSVTATEVTRNFNKVLEKAKMAGSVTIIKNSHPVAVLTPIAPATLDAEGATTPSVLDIASDLMDEYDDVFTELAQ